MSLTLDLPPSLTQELSDEATREGLSTEEHALLMLYITNALLKHDRPTLFKEAVDAFLGEHDIDTGRVAGAMTNLILLCAAHHDIANGFSDSA